MKLEKLLEELDPMNKKQSKTMKEGFDSDESVARELKLFIDNDGELYRQQTMPIMKNLARKMRKGVYDSARAVKLWKYLADSGAKKYAREHGGPKVKWSEMFPVSIRMMVAKELAEDFDDEMKVGGLDVEDLLKKESKTTTVTKGKLKEMVRKAVRKQLNEGAGAREWELLDKLRETGASDTAILEDLMRAMSTKEAIENLEHIANMWDVSVDNDLDDDDDDDLDW